MTLASIETVIKVKVWVFFWREKESMKGIPSGTDGLSVTKC